MEFDFSILEEKGISVTDGISYTGGKEKYVSALQRYFRGSMRPGTRAYLSR